MTTPRKSTPVDTKTGEDNFKIYIKDWFYNNILTDLKHHGGKSIECITYLKPGTLRSEVGPLPRWRESYAKGSRGLSTTVCR